MSRTCLRTIWHINHVMRDNRSPCSLMCLFNVEILSVFRWTCLDYTRLMNGFSRNGSRNRSLCSLWRTRFFAKRINIDLLRTGRFPFILHTNHVMRDIRSPRSLTNWIQSWLVRLETQDGWPASARWAWSEPNSLFHSCFKEIVGGDRGDMYTFRIRLLQFPSEQLSGDNKLGVFLEGW